MALFQRILAALCNRKYVEPEKKPKSKYDGYAVQHLKEAGIYVTLYKGHYLETAWPSGIIRRVPYSDWLHHAKQFHSEEAAWRYIDKHIDQQGRETTSFITR